MQTHHDNKSGLNFNYFFSSHFQLNALYFVVDFVGKYFKNEKQSFTVCDIILSITNPLEPFPFLSM